MSAFLKECSFFEGRYAENFICNYREADPWWYNAPGFDKETIVRLINSNITVAPPGSRAWYQSACIKRAADRQDGAFPRRHDDSAKLFIFSGTDPLRPGELGAEVSFQIGGEVHSFSCPCVVAVPKGTEYGSIVTRKLTRPYVVTQLLPHAAFNGCSLAELELPPVCPQTGREVGLRDGRCGMLFMPFENSVQIGLSADCGPFRSGGEITLSAELLSRPSEEKKERVTAERDCYFSFLSTDPDDPRQLGAEAEFVFEDELRRINISSMVFVPRGTSYIPPVFRSVSRPVIFSMAAVD